MSLSETAELACAESSLSRTESISSSTASSNCTVCGRCTGCSRLSSPLLLASLSPPPPPPFLSALQPLDVPSLQAGEQSQQDTCTGHANQRSITNKGNFVCRHRVCTHCQCAAVVEKEHSEKKQVFISQNARNMICTRCYYNRLTGLINEYECRRMLEHASQVSVQLKDPCQVPLDSWKKCSECNEYMIVGVQPFESLSQDGHCNEEECTI